MTGTMEESRVRSLLERAVADVHPARVPFGAVLAGARRRRRNTRMAATAVLAAAAVAVVGSVVAVPRLASVFRSAQVPTSVNVADGTVRVGGVTVRVPDGWTIDPDGRCATPRTVVVLRGVGVSGCGSGPSIVVSGKVGTDWSIGGRRPGLTYVDGVPLWVGNDGPRRSFVSVPYAHAFVELAGTSQQRVGFFDYLDVTLPDSPPVLASRSVVVAEAVEGSVGGGTDDRAVVGDLVSTLDRAERVEPGRACVPDPADQVMLSMQTSTDTDPETGPVNSFTTLITALEGPCRLAFSSTGAVVAPGPEFRSLVSHLIRN